MSQPSNNRRLPKTKNNPKLDWSEPESHHTEFGKPDANGTMMLHRRDELIEEVHGIYERGFGPDQKAFEASRLPELKSEETPPWPPANGAFRSVKSEV